jgi:hypothetical protein
LDEEISKHGIWVWLSKMVLASSAISAGFVVAGERQSNIVHMRAGKECTKYDLTTGCSLFPS